jgi:hypothetical protein
LDDDFGGLSKLKYSKGIQINSDDVTKIIPIVLGAYFSTEFRSFAVEA